MLIGQKLREVRESKKLSQGDVEKRTGLFRCYISRVENGHTIPSIETLEKYARALEIPMYRLFYDGDAPPQKPKLPKSDDSLWGSPSQESSDLHALVRLLARMSERDRLLLMGTAQAMVRRRRRRTT